MNSDDPFINYLCTLRYEDKGAIAALRRACGQRLAESRNCQWFASISTRPTDFLTATLVAQYSADQIQNGKHHTSDANKGSIGAAWAEYCRNRDPEQDPAVFYRKRQEALANEQNPLRPPSIHERFRTLLDAELQPDGTGELAYRLRGLIRMLAAEGIPIDVYQLARDLRGWRAESRYVQKRWAKAFYRPASSVTGTEEAIERQSEAEELEEIQDQEEDEDAD